jgi:hypothetical protein
MQTSSKRTSGQHQKSANTCRIRCAVTQVEAAIATSLHR